jgi:hypothetical protein
MWAGIDHQRGYHHQPVYGGVLDAMRLPKFSCHFFQSERPPHVRGPDGAGGPMVFIANFATFHSPTTVTVFSNCQQGAPRRPRICARFRLDYPSNAGQSRVATTLRRASKPVEVPDFRRA